MQFLCYFLHVFLFSLCKEEKKLVRAVFNFPVQIKLFSGRQLDGARKIEIVGRAGFVSMGGGSGWQGGKCIQASKLQLHGWKAYRSRLFNSCYVKKFSRQIHWELAEASLKKMKSS